MLLRGHRQATGLSVWLAGCLYVCYMTLIHSIISNVTINSFDANLFAAGGVVVLGIEVVIESDQQNKEKHPSVFT